MSHSYSRDKLEESRRRKRAQQAAQQQRASLPSTNSWRGVTPSQVAKPAQQTAPKTTAPKQNKTAPKTSTQTPQQNIQSAIRSGASYRGITPAQVTRNVSRPVVSLPVIHAAQERAQQVAQNDNSMRARIARSHEAERQRLAVNAAAIKQDKSRLASNSLKWHQTSDAAVRQRLEAENSAIRARRGYAYDSRTGSTFDSKGNELSLAARQIYGGRAETAKQFRDVAQTKDFVRDTSRTAAQPSILDVARGVTADNPHYAIQSGQKAHSIIASLLNRSGETWTDADTKARDEARDALQKEMQAIYQQYGATYQPRLSADETVKDLALRGADEQTLEYVRENLRLRDASDRLGQGLTAVGKRLEASIPSFVDTVKQAVSNQSENKENEAFTRLEEQEKQLELQLQNMQSQDENGKVPADYQQVYDQLQRVREEKNALKVTKGVDQNLWSQRMLREANEAQANAEAGLAPAPRWVTEQAISLAANAPTMAASAIPFVGPAAGSIMMGAQAAGQRTFELNEQGKSAGEALGRGLVSGVIEAATEKLPLERMAEILHSGGANAVKNILRQMGTEATEEGASYFLNYVSDLAAADPDAKFSLAELAQSAAGGAFGGLVFGTAGTVGAKLAQRNEGGIYDDTAYERDVVRSLRDADAQLRAARSMPEGAAREAAVSAAREKMSQTIADFVGQQAAESAERSAAYDADPNGRMSLAQRAQAAAYLNQRTGRADAWQDGQVKPRLGTEIEQRQESSYRTPEEENALQSQLAKHFADERQVETGGVYDKETVENYRNQIDGTFDGSLPSDMNISLGQTPKVLQSLGAENLPLRMTQNAARKIAYPDGYMGGKHNLGIPALKHLQEQLNDPIAVLKSKSQHDSFVVLTEWNDTENNPVVAAIHLNKQGVVDDVNMLASAYGKRNLAALLGENNENVIYTKNNKGINQTLDGRLQLPGLLSDDTLVAYSIRQNAGNSNTSAANIPLSEAMQYGKTPEQAMREANARAEGERTRQEREEQAAAEQQERLDRITNGKSRDIMQRVYEAQERAERVASRHALERATTRATTADADSYIDHTQEDIAIDLVNSLESERRFLTNLRNGWHLSEAELVNAERMAAGRGPVTEMDSHRYELVETYARAMRQYNEDMQPYYAFQRGLDDARLRRATELIKDSDNWKDSRGNLGLQIRTPERVLRKVMGDTAETEAIYQAYFAPVLKHDAEAIRWENTQRERLKGIMEGLSHEDSVYIHMKNRAELSPKNEAMQKQLADYMKENKSKIHFKHAESAMQKLYEMTSEMHPQVSEAGVRNGYAPLEFRQKYIPSLTPTKEGKWYNRILRKVGVETMVDELPTEIAGRTEDRRPGRQYAGFYNQREGINTEFDAFKAMDNYISGASNAIFHTDDIQNLRVLEDAIRGKYSDEGSRAEIEAIRKDPDINIEDKEQKISKIWERNSGTLPSFPSWIAEYTNILAGKKSRTDRSAEQMFGRGLYRAMSDVEGKVAADMVGGNLSTAISNFIPLAQGSGEVRYSSMMRAMLDYGTDLAKKNPAFHEDSDFLTNRRGSERVIKTKLQKASDAAGWTMNAIDNLSSEVMVRARYLDNVEKRHMSTEAALREADRWAAGLIGDRAKGAKPVIMESKSPLIKAFTMFQLEVMNQYDHLFGDIPHNLRVQGKSKAQIAAGTAAALLQVFIMSHLFNDAREKLTGSRGAFDPIEMVNDFVGRLTGYALPNIFDLLGEMMGDGIDEDDFRAEKSETAWDNVKKTAQDIASNVPFVSGPLGAVFGAGNSRLPIQSVIPNIDNIMTAQGEEARSMALKKELSKPLYGFLLPFGGLQAKKTVEGAATMFAGGSYSYNKNGEKILQFPVYGQTPRDWAQAVLFGKSSLKTAQDWAENGYDTLNADETKAFDTLRERMSWHGEDNSETVYAAIKAIRAFKDEAKGIIGDNESSSYYDYAAAPSREMLMRNNDLTLAQKEYLDKTLIGGDKTGDYSSEDAFYISQNVRETRQDTALEAAKHGVTPDVFAQYDNLLQSLDDEVDENGDALYNTNQKIGAVMAQVGQDEDLTDGEKQAVAGYVLITAMSKSDREKYADLARGYINPSDYVRFKGDLADYKKEFEGTDTDHNANVKRIIDGYSDLNDKQKSVLMSVYSNKGNNLFHVSTYEAQMDKSGSFYKGLTEDGRDELRTMLNDYESDVGDGTTLEDWKAKAYMAEKEAGISPSTYALYQLALQTAKGNKKSASQDAAVAAVNAMDGLTQSQKAYLYQSTNLSWKKNPFGSATVTKYDSGKEGGINPVEGSVVTSPFGPRQTFTTSNGATSSKNHHSIDLAAAAGTPIKAFESGKVTANGWVDDYGWTIEVTHPNGLISQYHHMQNQSGVAIGTEVKQGEQIGSVGSTGNSTGPHLDLSIIKDGKYIDPASVIPSLKESATGYVSQDAASYGSLTTAAQKSSSGSSKKSGGSGRSGGTSWSGLKNLKKPKGLPIF